MSKERTATTRPATTQPSVDPAGKRESFAQGRLQAADKLRNGGDGVAAYRGYKLVAERYAHTSASAAAEERVHAYEADEKFMAAYRQADAEHRSKAGLAIAAGYDQAGKTALAVEAYHKVISEFPGTPAAKRRRPAGQAVSVPRRDLDAGPRWNILITS